MYYDYEEEIKKEVSDYIEEEHLQEKIKNRSLDNEDLVEEIRDNSFITEGKIYTSEARECLLGNEDLLAEALENAGLDGDSKFLMKIIEDPTLADGVIRDYVLYDAVEKTIDELNIDDDLEM